MNLSINEILAGMPWSLSIEVDGATYAVAEPAEADVAWFEDVGQRSIIPSMGEFRDVLCRLCGETARGWRTMQVAAAIGAIMAYLAARGEQIRERIRDQIGLPRPGESPGLS